MKKTILLLLFLCSAALFANGTIQLNALFQDGAVFQQNKDIPVWGKAGPKQLIYGEFAGQKVAAKANAAGEFMLRFAPVKAGGPYTMTISDPAKKTSVTVKDILVGEVWIASGQSNMDYQLGSDWAFPLNLRNNPNSLARQQQKEFNATIKDPSRLRYFLVPRISTGTRETTLTGSWKYADAKNAAGFSAVAAWFAKKLQEKLNVPVGIIVATWGGTRVEAWTSREALLTRADTAVMVREADDTFRNPAVWTLPAPKKTAQRWKKDPGNKGFGLGYAKLDYDDSSWKNMRVPGSWIAQQISGNGAIWIRKEVTLPADWAGKDLIFEMGGVDKQDIAYFNGVEIGRTGKDFETEHWNRKRTYHIPGKLVRTGKNVLAVRAYSFIYDGAFYGFKDDYLLRQQEGGKKIQVAGTWKAYPEINYGILSPASQPFNPTTANAPGNLFDGMINPLIPYAFRGVIWYQGEQNGGNLENAAAYEKRLETMVRDWRFRWGLGDFPFIQVQLAFFDNQNEGPFLARSPWAHLRDSQRMVCENVPNVFMASAIDNGDPKDIHPQDKKTVGNRLAVNALHNVYGFEDIIPSGPIYKSYSVEGNQIRITFRYGKGLYLKGNFRKGFYICGSNGEFYPADKIVIERNSILLSSKEVAEPIFVRFAWTQAPETFLYNDSGLPASSFRTDR